MYERAKYSPNIFILLRDPLKLSLPIFQSSNDVSPPLLLPFLTPHTNHNNKKRMTKLSKALLSFRPRAIMALSAIFPIDPCDASLSKVIQSRSTPMLFSHLTSHLTASNRIHLEAAGMTLAGAGRRLQTCGVLTDQRFNSSFPACLCPLLLSRRGMGYPSCTFHISHSFSNALKCSENMTTNICCSRNC